MSASRLQRLQAGFYQAREGVVKRYQDIKTWCSEKLESEYVVRIKGMTKGAIKAALGVHYIFDLGLSVIPATSAWYNGIKIVKYTATAMTFGLSAYNACQESRIEKNYHLNLERKLLEAQKIKVCAKKLAERNDELIKLDGFEAYLTPNVQQETSDETKINYEENIFIPTSKTEHYAQAILNSAVTASGLYYISDFIPQIVSVSRTYENIRNFIVLFTLLCATLTEYDEVLLCERNNKKLTELEKHFANSQNILSTVEKKIGTVEQLKKVAKDNNVETEDTIEVVIDKPTMLTTQTLLKSKISVITESTPAIYFRSLINGAKSASGIHYLFEIAIPEIASAKYVVGITTLACSTYRTLKQFQAKAIAEKKLQELSDEIIKANKLIQCGEQLLEVQMQIVQEHRKAVDNLDGEQKSPEDDASEKYLMEELDELSNEVNGAIALKINPRSDSAVDSPTIELSDLSPLRRHSFLKVKGEEFTPFLLNRGIKTHTDYRSFLKV